MTQYEVRYYDYSVTKNNIHIFQVNKPFPGLYDEWLADLERIYSETQKGETVRYIVDYTPERFPPLGYAFQRTCLWYRSNENYLKTRVVVLADDPAMRRMLETLVRRAQLPNITVNFMPRDRYQQAKSWLLYQAGGQRAAGD